MRFRDILEAIGDEDDLIEQLKYDGASIVTDIYNSIRNVSEDFTLIPTKEITQEIISAGRKMFIYRASAIKALGEDSNTVAKINKVIEYIMSLK